MAYRAAVEAHRSHPPRLRRDRDGVYHCAACNPGHWWERLMDWLFLTRLGRACWSAVGAAVIFGLAILFQCLGWYG